jgi:hypothetical protein
MRKSACRERSRQAVNCCSRSRLSRLMAASAWGHSQERLGHFPHLMSACARDEHVAQALGDLRF